MIKLNAGVENIEYRVEKSVSLLSKALMSVSYPSTFQFIQLFFCTQRDSCLVGASLSGTAHSVDPTLALLLDQLGTRLDQLGQWYLASLLSCVGKVVRQDHLVDIDTSDTSLNTLVQDRRDELVCAVQYDLDSTIDLLLDRFETVDQHQYQVMVTERDGEERHTAHSPNEYSPHHDNHHAHFQTPVPGNQSPWQ